MILTCKGTQLIYTAEERKGGPGESLVIALAMVLFSFGCSGLPGNKTNPISFPAESFHHSAPMGNSMEEKPAMEESSLQRKEKTSQNADRKGESKEDPLEQKQEKNRSPIEDRQEKRPAFKLEEFVVTATPVYPRDFILPPTHRFLDEETLQRRISKTTPDALDEEVGVVIQKTNLGGGSPIIRGRSGKEILLLIDGQRFNNATFRRNNQYLNTIDLSAIGEIEIVRGPNSVVYGSDAMGGSVNVITRRRELMGERALHGRLFQQVESADKSFLSHLGVEGECGDFGFIGGFTVKSFDDLRAGSHGDPAGAVDTHGRQVPTGYDEMDFSFSLLHPLSETESIDFLILQTRQKNVPRSDRLIPNDKNPNPPDLLREYDPQVLRWYELRYRLRDPGETLESLTVTASLNNPYEGRRRIKASSPNEMLLEEDEVFSPALSARVGIEIHPDHLLTAGMEGTFETIDSKAKTVDLTTGIVTPRQYGRYPDGAKYRSFGVFIQDGWQISEGLRWINGIRYSLAQVRLDFKGLQVGDLPPFEDLSETYDDFTFSTSLIADATENTVVYGTIARGFRAPNLDDLAALGDFASGNRVPNLDLKPESVLSLEVGTEYSTPSIHAGAAAAVAFYKDIFDNRFIFSHEGEDYYQVENASRANVYTLEGWVESVICPSEGSAPEHVVFAQGFWNIGRNKSGGEPLTKVPPPEITLGYRMEEGLGSWFAETFFRNSFKQGRLSAADEGDPRIPLGGTPAWWTFNIRGGIEIREGLRLSAALENIFDQRYRVHGSGIDAPGFNAILSLDWIF